MGLLLVTIELLLPNGYGGSLRNITPSGILL